MHELIVAFGVFALFCVIALLLLSLANSELKHERDSWKRLAESHCKELERLRDLAKQMRAED